MSVDDQTPVAIIGQPATTAVDLLRGAGFPVETGYVGYDVRSTQVLAKVDLQLGGGQSLGVRFNAARSLDENIEPWGGLTARSGGAAISSSDVMLAVSHTAIPSGTFVNELRGQIAYRDQDVRLTHREFRLLRAMVDARGRVLTRERLLETVWDEAEVDARAVDAAMRRLRSKLGPGRRRT